MIVADDVRKIIEVRRFSENRTAVPFSRPARRRRRQPTVLSARRQFLPSSRVDFPQPAGPWHARIHRYWTRTMAFVNRCALWSDRHLPPGVRAILGVLAMVCGVLGFLPVLGFWMFPLGRGAPCAGHSAVPPSVLKWLARQSG